MEDFSLIILCERSSHLLPMTLDTLKAQKGSFEVLLVGPGPFPEFAQSYPELKIRTLSSNLQSLAEMMNEGVRFAKGRYIQFLQSGDRYISQYGLSFLTELIEKRPSLISARCVVPDRHSYWMLKEKILELGGFDAHFQICPLQDFLTRFEKQGRDALFCRRVFLDAREGPSSFQERCQIFYRHHGLWPALRWAFVHHRSKIFQKSVSFFKNAFWKND